jgi:CheY-like chemotaxis protein
VSTFKSSVYGLAAASILGMSLSAFAQQAGQPKGQPAGQPAGKGNQEPTGAAKQREENAKNESLLRDFIHFVKINRPDVAAGFGQQLLQRGLPATAFVDLVEKSGEEQRFEQAITATMRIPELEPVGGALLKLFDQGKLERVRNPDEIARNIGLLKGNMRAQMLARERLVAAGEYAVPQLLQGLLSRNDAELNSLSQSVLVNMGQQAITPLCTAIIGLDPVGQELVADVLGLIGYRTSVPYLAEVLLATKSDSVRKAAERAMDRIGTAGLSTDAAALYQKLAEDYYNQKPELTSFPGEDHQLLWSFNPTVGLTMTAIRTEVYHEAMAMRNSERSLVMRPDGNEPALSLWLASNFSREIDSPKDYQNPAYGANRREAMYYAVAAGAGPSESVLARGIDRRDTPLIRRAIEAIDQTAGGAALWSGGGERKPLIEALRYPNRRVQYEAALAIGKAQPTSAFNGSERVVPILASAVRDAAARFAVVIGSNREVADTARRILEKSGYTVLPVATSLQELAAPISEVPGVDLIIVSNLSPDATRGVITEARNAPKLGATPILAMTDPQGAIDLNRQYAAEPLVMVRSTGLREEQINSAVEQLVEKASGGPISEDEARAYAGRSILVLRDLAVSGNQVLDVGEASLSLIAAMNESKGEQKLALAEVLSRVNQKRVQVALMDTAFNGQGDEQIVLFARVSDSAKRFGNQLEPRQVQRVVEMASKAPGQTATAAAALMGSLNLSNNNLVPLILGQAN